MHKIGAQTTGTRAKYYQFAKVDRFAKKSTHLAAQATHKAKKVDPPHAKGGPRSGPLLRAVGRLFLLCASLVRLNGSTFLQIGRLSQIGGSKEGALRSQARSRTALTL